MTDKPIKKKKPGEKLNNVGPEYDSVREQNVLLEDIRRDVKAVAEGHYVLNRKFDEANAKLDEHTKRLDEQAIRLTKIELDVEGVKAATVENSQRIKKLQQGQEEMKSDIQELKVGQQRIEQKLDTVTTDHEQRLSKLEAVTQ